MDLTYWKLGKSYWVFVPADHETKFPVSAPIVTQVSGFGWLTEWILLIGNLGKVFEFLSRLTMKQSFWFQLHNQLRNLRCPVWCVVSTNMYGNVKLQNHVEKKYPWLALTVQFSPGVLLAYLVHCLRNCLLLLCLETPRRDQVITLLPTPPSGWVFLYSLSILLQHQYSMDQ